MENPTAKKRIRLGEVKKPSCCPPPSPKDDMGSVESCGAPSDYKPQATPANTEWTPSVYLNHLRCRLGAYRMSYKVAPGLYSIGNPGKNSDVFASANYGMSFDHLRRALKGTDSWVLVLDTKGINVWCAAGKGTFGTEELIERIRSVMLNDVVSHRRIILPQLAGPGVEAHTVKQKTGFRVCYGPVRAEDIRRFAEYGYMATKEMRKVRFTLLDRLVLTPMEVNPALKKYPLFALAVLVLFGLNPAGVSFKDSLTGGLPFLLLGLASIFSGAVFTPLFLGLIPSRAFSVKGWITGLLFTLLVSVPLGVFKMDWPLKAAVFLFFPAVSSYIAVQFTGSTVFTGISGVKKELKYAIPVYIASAAITVLLAAAWKFKTWGAL